METTTKMATARATSRTSALAYMAASASLFALMNFFARLASTSASWAMVGAVRALVGACVAMAVARLRGVSLAAKDRRAVFWRSVLGTIAMVTTFAAVTSPSLSLGDTVTLLNLSPVFLAVLAPIFLRERTSAGVAAAIFVSLAGVCLVVKPAVLFGGETMLPGAGGTAVVALLGALSTSGAMLLLRRVGQTESTEAIAVHFSLTAAFVMTAIAIFDLHVPTLRDVGLMFAGGLCAGFAQLALTRAYSLERAARVAPVGYLAIVVSAVLGAFALHEVPSALTIAGMALVIAGGILVAMLRA